MISKEQYLQAKKTIADYELQEWLFGNSELLDPDSGKTLTNVGGLWWETEPARGKTIPEEAKEKGFINGAIIVTTDDSRYILDSDPYMADWRHLKAKAFNTKTARSSDVIIWSVYSGWLVRKEGVARKDSKSPLQEAMDRGYRKGAVVTSSYDQAKYELTEDPEESSLCILCKAKTWPLGIKHTVLCIVDTNGEYRSQIVAPENK